MLVGNQLEVTTQNIETVVKLTRRTLDNLISTTPDDILASPSDQNEMNTHNSIVDSIITDKLRKKFKI